MATKKLHIHIVNYELGRFDGILSKFANKMYEQLEKKKNVKVTMSSFPNAKADINHHINYASYVRVPTKNTLMVTHIDTPNKIANLRLGMESADIGICMSDDTKDNLTKLGFDKLVTILPAHDGKPRRFQVVSILTNVYPDGCKREKMFTALVKTLDLKKWAFRIMGSGWHDILVPLVADGLQVDYFEKFEEETHQKILETSDYNLYFGEDEGSMAVLDAKNADLKIIAPNTGFHKDIGIDFPFHSQEELNDIFKELSVNQVEDWTWDKYINEHLEIWKNLK